MRISDWSSDVCSSDLLRCESGQLGVIHHLFPLDLRPPAPANPAPDRVRLRPNFRILSFTLREHSNMPVKIAVLKETRANERRVALVPAVADKLIKLGCEIHMQSEAGDRKSTRLNSSH